MLFGLVLLVDVGNENMTVQVAGNVEMPFHEMSIFCFLAYLSVSFWHSRLLMVSFLLYSPSQFWYQSDSHFTSTRNAVHGSLGHFCVCLACL